MFSARISDVANAALGLAPEAIDIAHVLAGATCRDFEKAIALCGFEELAFTLGQAMRLATASNFTPRGKPAGKAFDIIFTRALWHKCF